jgi:energy-coupling factor transporter ATP-binding protein EcfA2
MPEDSNPFATRFTRPGALEYAFCEGQDAQKLCAQLEANGWWGQIVGPHGSGKSTLLHTLAAELEARRRTVVWFTQTQSERSLAATDDETLAWNASTQVIVDGYEQLGWLGRRWLQRMCRRQRAGLLVTAHEDVKLPLLWATAPDERLVQQLVTQLQGEQLTVSAVDVSRCYQEHAGNVRETLFALYDLYQRKRIGGT